MSNILLDLFFSILSSRSNCCFHIASLITKLLLYRRIFFADINYGIRDTNAVTKKGVYEREGERERESVCVCISVHPSLRKG